MIVAIAIYLIGVVFTFLYINLTFLKDWEMEVFWHCLVFAVMSWVGAFLFWSIIKNADK